MYCGQCGKKVLENMLFCPFCGSPIVIPEQDEPHADKPAPQAELRPADVQPAPMEQEIEKEIAEERIPDRPVSLFDSTAVVAAPESEPQPEPEPFVPLSFDFSEMEGDDDWDEVVESSEEEAPEPEIPDAVEAAAPQTIFDISEEPAPQQRPARRPGSETRRPENAQKRAANTYIPIKEIDPEDMFMDDLDSDDDYDDDDYDVDEEYRSNRYHDDDFEFEEPEHGSFFQRHIRGIVGLILLLILMIICAAWAFSGKGQLALARMNLAWTAHPYATLGHEAYQQDSKLLAAQYFEKAYAREETNYEYAHSAMVAYYDAEDIESAAAMLKKCIEMAPDNPEPYQEMLVLYPDPATRPWEISELIRLGYQRTGDASLNVG